jgi:serine/threonine protein kinase
MLNLSILDDGDDIFIGKGTFGEVKKRRYAGTPVAVKRVFPEKREFLQKEVANLSLLTHPNIVSMLGFNQDLIVMSLADGNATNINSIEELGIVGRDCMRGLSYMHMHGDCMMHADLKPENILVYKNDNGIVYRAVIGDVGLASACNLRGGFMGTPGYMPDDDIPRSGLDDVFALGVSLLDSTLHDELVHTTHRTHPSPIYRTDNTFQVADRVEKKHDKLGKIIAFMLVARVLDPKIEVSILMNSLVNGFEEILNDNKLESKSKLSLVSKGSTPNTQPLSP